MKAIILAAGKGSRLAEYTNGNPKCLLKLGKETILEREIRILKECGIKEENIYVIGGYRYETLRAIAPNLIVNTEYDKMDNSYTLGIALREVNDDDILIMDSDLCFENDLITELLDDEHENVLMSKLSKDLDESTGIVTQKNGRVDAIGKKYQNTGYVYVSLFKISKKIIQEFVNCLLSDRSEKTWYTLAITELCDKYTFYNHVTECKWHEIDYIEDYEETIQMFKLEDNI